MAEVTMMVKNRKEAIDIMASVSGLMTNKLSRHKQNGSLLIAALYKVKQG
jgi:hypothetical protein